MKRVFLMIVSVLVLSSVANAGLYDPDGSRYKRPATKCTITWYGTLYCSPHIND